jgi:starch phosphorylase
MSRYANGVSALHGRSTRKSWQVLWPHHREDEVPVGHITNGVHVRTWLAPAMQDLYAKYMGADWRDHLADPRMWARIDSVPDAELWETHRVLKAALVRFVRRRVSEQRRRNDYPEELVAAAKDALDPEALTIGFARRFATYKRASLIFHDMARLKRLITNSSRPLQIAGQGPSGSSRQEVLREVREAAFDADLKNRVVFIEDYDINVGRHLVQGVDVAEQPAPPPGGERHQRPEAVAERRPQLLGAGRLVAEAYDGLNGPRSATASPTSTSRNKTAGCRLALRHAENMIVPLYYERDDHSMPRGWVERMKRTIRHAGLALQHRPHGDRLREQLLPPGRRREATTCGRAPRASRLRRRGVFLNSSVARRWLGT